MPPVARMSRRGSWINGGTSPTAIVTVPSAAGPESSVQAIAANAARGISRVLPSINSRVRGS